jgi:hypothetical protein
VRAFFGLRGRIEEDALTKVAHSANNFFESAVVGNGLLHRDRLGLPLRVRRYALGWLEHQAAWGNPTQFN